MNLMMRTGIHVTDFIDHLLNSLHGGANSISAIVKNYQYKNPNTTFLFAGGVMCNSIIKTKLQSICDSAFAEPKLSADNAVGIAALALRAYKSEHNL